MSEDIEKQDEDVEGHVKVRQADETGSGDDVEGHVKTRQASGEESDDDDVEGHVKQSTS